jgi:hypothetical protein
LGAQEQMDVLESRIVELEMQNRELKLEFEMCKGRDDKRSCWIASVVTLHLRVSRY